MKKIIYLLGIIVLFGITNVNAKNIVKAYSYNSSTCVTGEEETCVATTCYESKTAGSCPAGTIIKYKVNDTEEKYFHVLHDDGETLTLQQRENTTDNVAWYSSSSDNSQGPTTILPVLESATSSWSNVEDQTYTMGTTSFGTGNNAYTGCTESGCTTNTYTLGSRTAKARMITMQEATALGCTTSSTKSCPNWMNNYLYLSTSYGGTVVGDKDSTGATRYGYWTMSACSSYSSCAWYVYYAGTLYNDSVIATDRGARAVVVVDKEVKEETSISNDNANNNNNDDDKGQNVKVGDTLKIAYIGYVLGLVILVLGVVVLIQTYIKAKSKEV